MLLQPRRGPVDARLQIRTLFDIGHDFSPVQEVKVHKLVGYYNNHLKELMNVIQSTVTSSVRCNHCTGGLGRGETRERHTMIVLFLAFCDEDHVYTDD